MLGLAGFAVYCTWWGVHLATGRLAPSIWSSLTGLPCPTTGFTRSLLALMAGDFRESLLLNPLTTVFLLLLALSLACLAWKWKERRRLVLSPPLAALWAVTLVAAWAFKFLLGPKYW
jgi:hypothetical protein